MDSLMYELRPFLYLFASFAGHVLGGPSKVATICAAVLTGCSLMIIYWRSQNRGGQRAASVPVMTSVPKGQTAPKK